MIRLRDRETGAEAEWGREQRSGDADFIRQIAISYDDEAVRRRLAELRDRGGNPGSAAMREMAGHLLDNVNEAFAREASPSRAPDVRGWTVVSRRSSELVPQFEGEGHGNQLSVAVPHQLCAGRVALASEPPAEAPDQTDSVAEARRRRQLA